MGRTADEEPPGAALPIAPPAPAEPGYGRSVPQGLLRVHPDLERETDDPISFRDAGEERPRNAI
jgi:hypothetical protein